MAGEFNAGSVVAKLKLVDDGFGSKLSDAFSSASKFQKGLMAMGAAAAAVGTTIAVLTQQSADYTDKLGKMAQQIGMTTEQLSSYSLAASLSDISTEEFGKSVSLLSRKMVDAANGNEEAAKSFAQLGISVKNANGSLKTSDQVLEEIADGFAGAQNSATKTALAMDLMGRSGASMIPLLNGGSKEIRNIREEAQRMGLVFSNEAFKAAEQFNDAQTRIAQSLIGLRQQLTASVIDIVNQSGAFDTVSAAIQKVTQWWMDLDASTRETATKIALATVAFIAVAGAIAAVAVILPVVTAGFIAMWTAAGPITLIIAAVAGLAAAMVILTASQKDSLKIANQQKTALAGVAATYEELSGKVDLTEDETRKLAQADAELERIAKELGKTLDITNKSLDEKKRIMQEMRQEVRWNIFDNWTKGLADLVNQTAAIRNLRDWVLRAREAGSTEQNNPFLRQQIENLRMAEIGAFRMRASLDDLWKKFAEFDKPEAQMRGLREIRAPGEGRAPKPAGGAGGKKGLLLQIGEGADMLAGPMQQVQQWFDRITGLMSKLSADQAQIAQNRITTLSNFGNLWAEVHMKNVEKAHEAERAELQEHEDAKLSVIRNALDIKLSLINEEFAARKLALEAELAAQKAGIDEMTAARIAEAKLKSVDAEERTAAVATIEEDALRLKAEADKDHQEKVDTERTHFQNKTAVETKKANDEYEAEKKASASRMMALEKKQADEKKDISKKSAAFQYALSLAGFHISQQQAIAQAKFQYAQAMMGAVATGMQFGMGAIVAIPALMAMANMAYMSSVAAIHSNPPPLPPAELFGENGGMVPGPRHSQGGVRAELEGGEFIMPRGPAMANLAMLEAMRSGRDNAGGGVTVIMHVGSMDPAGRSVESVGRELGLSVRAHL